MICGLWISIAFALGWLIGGYQSSRNWQKWVEKCNSYADFWQTEFLSLLSRLEPMRVSTPKTSKPMAGEGPIPPGLAQGDKA